MSDPVVLTNAWVVTIDKTFIGTVEVMGGHIVAVYRGVTRVEGAQDLDGDYLIPGLVEVHSDNLHRTAMPRPGVRWPALPAVLTHDAAMVAAGITTVLDTVALGDPSGTGDTSPFGETVAALKLAEDDGLTRSRHLLHLRCEVRSQGLADALAGFVDDPSVRMVSITDRTPCRRDKDGDDADGRRQVATFCREQGVALASHDDSTAEDIRLAATTGGAIAEFPITIEAARAAHDHGMQVVAGAPNLVQGGSPAGNVSAADLAGEGLVDILSSDYVPSSGLYGAFALHRQFPQVSLAEALALVTANPARAAGLTDRGEIAPGKRADLVRASGAQDMPVVSEVWRGGRRVF